MNIIVTFCSTPIEPGSNSANNTRLFSIFHAIDSPLQFRPSDIFLTFLKVFQFFYTKRFELLKLDPQQKFEERTERFSDRQSDADLKFPSLKVN